MKKLLISTSFLLLCSSIFAQITKVVETKGVFTNPNNFYKRYIVNDYKALVTDHDLRPWFTVEFLTDAVVGYAGQKRTVSIKKGTVTPPQPWDAASKLTGYEAALFPNAYWINKQFETPNEMGSHIVNGLITNYTSSIILSLYVTLDSSIVAGIFNVGGGRAQVVKISCHSYSKPDEPACKNNYYVEMPCTWQTQGQVRLHFYMPGNIGR